MENLAAKQLAVDARLSVIKSRVRIDGTAQSFALREFGVLIGGGKEDIASDFPAGILIIPILLAVILQPAEQRAQFQGAMGQFLEFNRHTSLEYPLTLGVPHLVESLIEPARASEEIDYRYWHRWGTER